MELIVRGAQNSDLKNAWPLYRNFVVEHVFSGKQGRPGPDKWNETEEKEKFSKLWGDGNKFAIEIDGRWVGWASSSQQDDVLVVENFFIAPGWQNQGIAERIFHEMIPVWKQQRLTVDVPILKGTKQAEVVEAALGKLGFSAQKADENKLCKVMRGKW